ncbi:MAG TPA: ABC transporter permease subunit [Microvirga sp.]|jgi:putative spermidine/putrescine transport system permease protein|nr:ABC transporter permease subunit [Microvirga sp.]
MARTRFDILLLAPLAAFAAAFLLLPLAHLVLVAGGGRGGLSAYAAVVTEPRYLRSLIATLALAAATTCSTLLIATVAAQFLAGRRFPGRNVLVAMLTFPLPFPGVVVGFMVILLGGRLGLIGALSEALTGERIVFAYSMAGLFIGYLYFSIPRVILTVIAAVEKLDPALVEAARSLGAGPVAIQRDVILPALAPALFAAGALCFATAMGAFGTAFTLATRIDVLPMVIYTEFTLAANVATAAALSLVLGLLTWIVLAVARNLSGGAVAAAG